VMGYRGGDVGSSTWLDRVTVCGDEKVLEVEGGGDSYTIL
jgi:hypothetical protein